MSPTAGATTWKRWGSVLPQYPLLCSAGHIQTSSVTKIPNNSGPIGQTGRRVMISVGNAERAAPELSLCHGHPNQIPTYTFIYLDTGVHHEVVLTGVGGGAGSRGHAAWSALDGRHLREVVATESGVAVQGRVDWRWQQGMGETPSTCHEVQSLQGFLTSERYKYQRI